MIKSSGHGGAYRCLYFFTGHEHCRRVSHSSTACPRRVPRGLLYVVVVSHSQGREEEEGLASISILLLLLVTSAAKDAAAGVDRIVVVVVVIFADASLAVPLSPPFPVSEKRIHHRQTPLLSPLSPKPLDEVRRGRGGSMENVLHVSALAGEERQKKVPTSTLPLPAVQSRKSCKKLQFVARK